MFFSRAFMLFMASAVVVKAMPQFGFDDNNDNNDNSDFGYGGDSTNDGGDTGGTATLNADAVQTGSAQTGQEQDSDPEQVDSATDNANFINFCSGQTLTNGLQNEQGSCNGIVMGQLPSVNNMISTIITNPSFGQTIQANQDFTINVQTQHLTAGFFTNPDNTYYSAPQQLDDNGDIIGHAHVTVQNIGALNPTTPPDPQTFDFFLGINDDGNGQGLLSAAVDGGLDAGTYRVCTILSAANHQAVNMPVAQRGAQDDCVRFNVADTGSGGNGTKIRRTPSHYRSPQFPVQWR